MRLVSDQRAGSGDGGGGAEAAEGARDGAVMECRDMFAVRARR
jgi:hypothetical protein